MKARTMRLLGWMLSIKGLLRSGLAIFAFVSIAFLMSSLQFGRLSFLELRAEASLGDIDAQCRLGVMYYEGKGVYQDYAKAIEWLRDAAERGSAEAQNRLGIVYYEGRGATRDFAKAAEWYRKAAESGFAKAQSNLSGMYLLGKGVAQDDAESARWARMAADNGDAQAQMSLATFYRQGIGVDRDTAEAAKWCLLSASQGLAQSQYDAGVMYSNGEGVTKNEEVAALWYRKAADQGLDEAESNLAAMYFSGHGVPRDYGEAAKFYRRAAEQGYARAEGNLGELYYFGKGVPRDVETAMKWYQNAADAGLAEAQTRVGEMYFAGDGVPIDHATGYMWLLIAANQRFKKAVVLLEIFRKIVSQEQMEVATRRAAAWASTRLPPSWPDLQPSLDRQFNHGTLLFRSWTEQGYSLVFVVDSETFQDSFGFWKSSGALRHEATETDFRSHSFEFASEFALYGVTAALHGDTSMFTGSDLPVLGEIIEPDRYGHLVARHMFSFTYTKSLADSIDWSGFDAESFRLVAGDFRDAPEYQGDPH